MGGTIRTYGAQQQIISKEYAKRPSSKATSAMPAPEGAIKILKYDDWELARENRTIAPDTTRLTLYSTKHCTLFFHIPTAE